LQDQSDISSDIIRQMVCFARPSLTGTPKFLQTWHTRDHLYSHSLKLDQIKVVPPTHTHTQMWSVWAQMLPRRIQYNTLVGLQMDQSHALWRGSSRSPVSRV